MKNSNLILIWFLLFTSGAFSQILNGQLIELTKKSDEVKIPQFDSGSVFVETELEKFEEGDEYSIIAYQTKIEKDGTFEVDLSQIQGQTLTFYFSSPAYSYIVLRDIPRSKIESYIKVIPTVKNIWSATCGNDCFTVNKKKTYGEKRISADYGQYRVEFERKIIEPDHTEEEGYLLPTPFRDSWPPDVIYFYEFKYK